MCFVRAISVRRSLSQNTSQCYCRAIAYHCGFAACRRPLLTNILPSDYPIHQTVLVQNRRNSVTFARTACDASCAAMVTQFRTHVPVWCSGNCAKLCARVAQGGAAIRAGCAHCSWFGRAMNVPGYRSSGAVLCCAQIHQRWWAQRLPIVVPCALVVAEPWVWPVQDER